MAHPDLVLDGTGLIKGRLAPLRYVEAKTRTRPARFGHPDLSDRLVTLDPKRGTRRPPCANTFLIGAQKSGTTYLSSLLDQSPEVCLSGPKEPQFFSKRFDEGMESYGRHFARIDAPVILDASTTYSFLRPAGQVDRSDAPGLLAPVPERIAAACPEARFIYILRDPIERAVSALQHRARTHPLPRRSMPLVEALEANPMVALISRYGDQIERYLEVFPLDRFLFLDFHELRSDPRATLDRTCDFLGISRDGFDLDRARGEKNATFTYSPVGRHLRRLDGLKAALRDALPDRARIWLRDRLISRPSEYELTDLEGAAHLFAEDRAKVTALTGLSI